MSVPDPSDLTPDLSHAAAGDVGDVAVAAAGLHGSGHGGHGPVHTHCENCGAALQGPYCHRCGQHDFPFHASFGHVFLDALENFFHFEGKFFRNVLTLLFRPGELTAAFNAGKRASQMPPFRLYLFVSVLFFVTLLASGTHPPPSTQPNETAAAAKVEAEKAFGSFSYDGFDPATKAAIQRLQERAKAKERTAAGAPRRQTAPANPTRGERIKALFKPMLNESFREHVYEQFLHTMPRLLLIALPLFALYTRVLFRGAGQVYLQHLVTALHYHTFIYLWMLVRDGWSGLITFASPTLGSVLETLCTWWMFVYTVWMFRRLFANSWPKTLLKTALLTAAYSMTLAVIFLGGLLALLATD